MKKEHITFTLLALMNLTCALFHAIFQCTLLSDDGRYREFLLTENLVITFVFLYFALAIFWGKPSVKQAIINMNIYFWLAFLVFVSFTQPEVTSLSIIKGVLFLPEYCYLLFLGTISFVLSVVNNRKTQENTIVNK